MTKIILIAFILIGCSSKHEVSEETQLKMDSIIMLKNEIYLKDSLVMSMDIFMTEKSYKDAIRFKKYYFQAL